MTKSESDVEEDLLHRAEVPPELNGLRLDAVCARLFDDWSRSRLTSWITQGRLQVNGEVADKGRMPVKGGDVLVLEVQAEPDTRVLPEVLPLEVVYQDKSIALINKPAGVTVHPGAGISGGTLQNALLNRWPQTAVVPRAGLVHRLDKDTSGLLVIALTLPAHTRLVEMIAGHDVRREYDAVVHGALVSGGSINTQMGRHPNDRIKMAVLDRGGREAITHYRIHERFASHTHLRVKLETGRTHQIRVHMAHLKHPIIGDRTYGGDVVRGRGMDEDLRAVLKAFPRQALHARELALEHPISGKEISFSVEPPKDMQALLKVLREHAAAHNNPTRRR
jgi:23S rRNA pseudouridine1911/1915/1917 synthase